MYVIYIYILHTCGVRCGASTIPGLLYADDTSLFGNDAASLKHGLSVLEKWCTEWGVKINTKKSGIIHFRKRGVKRVSWEFPVQGESIPIKKYPFLESKCGSGFVSCIYPVELNISNCPFVYSDLLVSNTHDHLVQFLQYI